jgi:dihydroflavonol-4-reductase
MILDFLNGVHPAYLDFDMNLVDVRDAAQGHWLAALRGSPGQRYILSGENLSLGRILEILQELTGLAMPRTKIPYALAWAVGLISEFVADYITRKPPKATLTGVRLAGTAMHFDGSRARRELGLAPRPARESLAEAVAWLQHEGRVHRSLQREPLASLQSGERR